jgi:RHS repeat-associated protein
MTLNSTPQLGFGRRIISAMAIGLLMQVFPCAPNAAAQARTATATESVAAMRVVPGFEEPLVALGSSGQAENAALQAAIAAYVHPVSAASDFAGNAKPFESFLIEYPASTWRAAILTNLGIGYYRAGYFTKATSAWERAWDAGRGAETPAGKALADRAIGELARMHARLGHAKELEALFADLGERSVSGPATEMITGAREGLWMFQNDPGQSYLCGPMALKSLLTVLKADAGKIKQVEAARSGEHGFSLAQVGQLATDVGQGHRLVFRTPAQAVPVPSIINWKLNHYAAIVGEKDGRYHIQDPTFASGDLWVTKSAIDTEGSGYFLVPSNGMTQTKWRTASADEAQRVYGMGFTTVSQPAATTPDDVGLNNSPTCGMCVVNAKTMLVSLNLNDTPVGYVPPIGPPVKIRLTYNQREANQPANFSFFNVSPKWTMNMLSWVQDNPISPGSSVLRYVAGGGAVDYASSYTFNSNTGAFSPERQGQAVLVRIPATGAVTSYELRMADGSKQVFGKLDGAAVTPRRIFLTRVIDPAGNALSLNYDAQMRLTSITDATGRNTTLSYTAANPLLVTQITDPFGRHADLAYDESGRLASIRDVVGIVSSFSYDAGGMVNVMTTPYGTNRFVYGTGPSSMTRFLELTDPLGFTERVEFRHNAPGIPDREPVAPAGLANYNTILYYRNTFYWDKNVYPITHTDYTQARITHWLHNPLGQTSPVIESTREPLERRVWKTYPNQTTTFFEGSAATPTQIARVLDDGTTQSWRYTYNTIGKPLTAIDPAGRKSVYTYSQDGIDLLSVQQVTAASGTLSTIASFTYNAQHLPVTYTDAAGQMTKISYNAAGQKLAVTDPLNQTTRYAYDALGYLVTAFNKNGKPEASFTYDGFGRIATRTDAGGHTIGFQYDALDRLISTSYPDGTSTQSVWDKLDLVSVTDRLGRQTRYTYDANRNLVAMTDPQGRQTSYAYYPNGTLQALTDPQGNVTRWTRDIQSRPTARIYADNSQEIYTYEATTSRLKAVADATTQARGYGYTVDDRPAAVAYANATAPTPPVNLTYDPYFPRITSMTDGSGTTQFQYGALGAPGALKLTAEITPFQNGTTSYQYDALGRPTSRTIGTSTENFSYDPLGRLVGASNDLGQFSYGYLGETGQRTSLQLGSILGTTWSYNDNVNDRRLAAVTNSGATRSYQYTSTPENRITRITETLGTGGAIAPQTWDYGYDASDRLLNGQASGGAKFGYTYDAADNITGAQGPAFTRNATYNRVNQTTSANGVGVTYAANGNVIDDGERTYQWDAENRLVGIGYKAQPGKQTTFRYDGTGRRIASVETGSTGSIETRYLWCGETLCQARGADDSVTRRYFAEGEAWSGSATKLYYAKDNLGSVRDVLAAQNGTRVASFDYDPYGNTTQTQGRVSTDFRYAGMFYHQASGLYLTEHRAYDPKAGRWLSRDPIREQGGANLYGYVEGNPIAFVDPLGLDRWGSYGYGRYVPSTNPSPSFWESLNFPETPEQKALGDKIVGGFCMGSIGGITRAINLPGWRAVTVDMAHILERHIPTAPLAAGRSVFVDLTESGIMAAVRQAYASAETIAIQGERTLLSGVTQTGMTVEMWLNRATKTIETAYPVAR